MTAPAKPLLTLDFTKTHTRYKNAAGKVVPGVTTILGMLNKPYLLKWAHQLGLDGKQLDATRQVAADIGTIAHGLCEAHLRGMDLDRTNLAPDMLAKAETSFLRFLDWWDREQLTLLHSELRMVSEKWQVGGTLDILAKRPDGAMVLVDLKTSKAIYDEMLLQVSAYEAIYNQTAPDDLYVQECVVVRIGKEDADDLEIRHVDRRKERAHAFELLVYARKALQDAGVRV